MDEQAQTRARIPSAFLHLSRAAERLNTRCRLSKVIETDVADDVLVGADAIAAFTGSSRRSAYWNCERGHIPAFKLANKWCLRKSTYRNLIARLEAGDAA
jgi:hypothetical protein